ncbi:hypothetical protein ACIQWZ_39050 [Streptomyces sp. NPDC098077]|uniref:hypothetical protein n=1 Tax=Streptomyces sp. NPDC098077 TaxID=3366093 RepID=UPI0037FB4168
MTRWLGVALLPSADHTRAAIRLQGSLSGDVPLQPPLSEHGNLPHLTVFQGPFQEDVDPGRELASIGAALSLPERLSLASVGIVHQPTGWLFMSVERPALLEQLQEVVLDVVARSLDRQAFGTTPEDASGSARRSGRSSLGAATATQERRTRLTSRSGSPMSPPHSISYAPLPNAPARPTSGPSTGSAST